MGLFVVFDMLRCSLGVYCMPSGSASEISLSSGAISLVFFLKVLLLLVCICIDVSIYLLFICYYVIMVVNYPSYQLRAGVTELPCNIPHPHRLKVKTIFKAFINKCEMTCLGKHLQVPTRRS